MRRFATGPVLAGIGVGTALLYFVGMATELPALSLATKPFPALALAAWVSVNSPRALGRLTAAGLVLSAAGDVLLEIGLFLPGLLAFLAVRILSRRRLLRIFQVPGLVLLPVVFGTGLQLTLPGNGAQSAMAATLLWLATSFAGGAAYFLASMINW